MAGYELVRATLDVNHIGLPAGHANVFCPEGKVAVGGGVAAPNALDSKVVVHDWPHHFDRGYWIFSARWIAGAPKTFHSMDVYVVCLDMN